MSLPRRNLGLLGALAVLVAVVVGGILLFRQLEWYAPRIEVHLERATVGRRAFAVKVGDRGTGLSHVSINLVSAGASRPIHSQTFSDTVHSVDIPVQLDPGKYRLTDGPGVLSVTAVDRSYWRFFSGNETTLDKVITLDFRPPTVEITGHDRYVTHGGTGFVTYNASSDTERTGIRVGRYFFPAYKGQFADGARYLAFFSHPYDLPVSERAMVVAEDYAGNKWESPLAYNVQPLRYRSVRVPVSDDFIRRKIVPLVGEAGGAGGGPREQFVKVNRDLRRVNEDTIRKACQDSAPRKLWDGRFAQLANSSVQANFADRRSYYYRDEKIDEARHLGYDLAVTRRYPVGASNSGAVVFAGPLGIYGNTVIIDHGFGLCSLYSHLSSVAATTGQMVKKGTKIGRTGETGLAVGDHLHYGVYIHGVAVLPLEWWDAKWIRDNVAGKLKRPAAREESAATTNRTRGDA
ncbi:MAG: M23 family metallopeptidase [Deltaproteobacteria bacterium]|nr:M23 family metallopeptidase [Deltaproteobacteria bacterium]